MLSWLAAVVIGIIVGVILSALAGGKSPGLAALAGLVGAVAGRLLLSNSLKWHPHTLGAIIGAVVLAVIWVLATRGAGRTPSASAG